MIDGGNATVFVTNMSAAVECRDFITESRIFFTECPDLILASSSASQKHGNQEEHQENRSEAELKLGVSKTEHA